jgi:hypothetical protein
VRDPNRLRGVGMLRKDTTTNENMRDGMPEIMVAYKDNQVYPEFLVTFAEGDAEAAERGSGRGVKQQRRRGGRRRRG